MSNNIDCQIPEEYAGQRFDQALAALLPDYSRSRLQQWIKDGHIRLDGKTIRPRDRVLGGEKVSGSWPQEKETSAQAEDIALDILYEDEDVLIINKPAGMVVHPAAGNLDGTLVNALLHHAPELAALPRAGLVHRLDKNTSGLLVVARSERAHTELVKQLQKRTMGREYRALVNGVMISGGTVDASIGRHHVDRKRMAVVTNGKPAVTHYRVLERLRAHSYLQIKLETGRTHQIRVHMSHIHFPIVGDPVYGGRLRVPAGANTVCLDLLRGFKRQALHAARLSLLHPASAKLMQWEIELPDDMSRLLSVLQQDKTELND